MNIFFKKKKIFAYCCTKTKILWENMSVTLNIQKIRKKEKNYILNRDQ